MRAVESGPPETARRRARADPRTANRDFASAAETGAAGSAADTLLFPIDALLHPERRAGIFAQHLSERSAGGLLLAPPAGPPGGAAAAHRAPWRWIHIWSRH